MIAKGRGESVDSMSSLPFVPSVQYMGEGTAILGIVNGEEFYRSQQPNEVLRWMGITLGGANVGTNKRWKERCYRIQNRLKGEPVPRAAEVLGTLFYGARSMPSSERSLSELSRSLWADMFLNGDEL